MTKKIDPDIKCLRACVRHIDQSTSRRMEIANVEYLYDRYVRNPTRVLRPRVDEKQPRTQKAEFPKRRSTKGNQKEEGK